MIAAFMVWWWFGPCDRKIFFDGMFGSLVGGFITAVVTLGLIWLGMEQLEGLADTAKAQARTTAADFILRRVDLFFRAETRALFHLVEDDYLVFEQKDPFRDSFFRVNEEKIGGSGLPNQVQEKLLKEHIYSTYEVDDLLLGPLEDLGSLEADEAKLISFDQIYEFFSWYLCRTWENKYIQCYVEGARNERKGARDLYQHLESLAKCCAKREAEEPER